MWAILVQHRQSVIDSLDLWGVAFVLPDVCLRITSRVPSRKAERRASFLLFLGIMAFFLSTIADFVIPLPGKGFRDPDHREGRPRMTMTPFSTVDVAEPVFASDPELAAGAPSVGTSVAELAGPVGGVGNWDTTSFPCCEAVAALAFCSDSGASLGRIFPETFICGRDGVSEFGSSSRDPIFNLYGGVR